MRNSEIEAVLVPVVCPTCGEGREVYMASFPSTQQMIECFRCSQLDSDLADYSESNNQY